MGHTAAPETSRNLPYTPCKIPQTKNQYSFHCESLKLRCERLYLCKKPHCVLETFLLKVKSRMQYLHPPKIIIVTWSVRYRENKLVQGTLKTSGQFVDNKQETKLELSISTIHFS
jgi:hypothetical protein